MNVTLKNTRTFFYLSIANILVCALIFLFYFTGIRPPFIYGLLWEYCVVLVLTLIYFIKILLYFNEATAVVAAFTMFTCVLTISVVNILMPRLLKTTYAGWLDTLAEVISLLVAFRAFFVKAPAISLPFKLLGAGVALLSAPRMFALLIITSFNEELVGITGQLGALVVLISVVFVLKRVINFLKNQTPQSSEAVEEQS